jgi:formylglycine-generating enzyme required for sulfatase activity/predicted Ser/Thr protein kinase
MREMSRRRNGPLIPYNDSANKQSLLALTDYPMDTSPDSQALPSGTHLHEFVIERVLGSGGFGITYLAKDTALGRQVVIKENLPVQFCFRDPSSLTVAPRHSQSDDVDNFQWSLENFSKEAAMLASLHHPCIVQVLRSFQACGTAYFVMPYVEGITLEDLLQSRHQGGQSFTEQELQGLLERVLAALDHLHQRGIYHRDIKPGNILITNDGVPVLIDFGSARQRLSERSMTVVESAGYTPFEQLQTRGRIGPWSDLYALGATLAKVITGEAPPKAADRAFDDPCRPLQDRADLVGKFSVGFLEGIDRSLKLQIEDRWQNAGEWQAVLRGETAAQPVAATPKHVPVTASAAVASAPVAGSQKKTNFVPWAVAACMVLGLVAVGKSVSNDKAEVVAAQARDAEQRAAQAEREKRSLPGSKAGEERDFEIAEGVKMTFCWIPPGEFLMGSPEDELGRFEDETQHRVNISKGFWMAKTEVTQAQWLAGGGIDTTSRLPAYHDEKEYLTWNQISASGGNAENFKGDLLPAERMDWSEARDWCLGMTERMRSDGVLDDGWVACIPTEAQWEYACRAETKTALNNGHNLTSKNNSDNLDEVAWYEGNSNSRTHPVGKKRSNAWGLHDMHGNVWEWCADWYGSYPTGDVVDPEGPTVGSHRVHRCGGWYNDSGSCRSANRYRSAPHYRGFRVGLRPVLVLSFDQTDHSSKIISDKELPDEESSIKWNNHRNKRFGSIFYYPDILKLGTSLDNGAGRTLTKRDIYLF